MPELMMCPMRSDAKIERHCEPLKCMWARQINIDGGSAYVCSASPDERFRSNRIEYKYTGGSY